MQFARAVRRCLVRRVCVLCACCTVALSVPLAGAVIASPARAAGHIPILGFQQAADPVTDIARSADGISSVGVDGLSLLGPGTVSAVGPKERAQLDEARAHDLPAVLLVTNYSARSNAFTEKLAHQTLRSRRMIRRLVRRLMTDIVAGGWDGVMLDLELLKPRDSAGLVRLSAELRRALPAHDEVSLAISNNTKLSGFASEGYDLAALARTGAKLLVMAYDQHGPWERRPGPVGSLPWTKRGLAVMRTAVPADQIILGVAGYGYGWRQRKHFVYSDALAQALAKSHGARTRWAPAAGEWTTRLRDHTTIWFSNARSLAVRVALAKRLHLAGVAVWSLRESDPIRR